MKAQGTFIILLCTFPYLHGLGGFHWRRFFWLDALPYHQPSAVSQQSNMFPWPGIFSWKTENEHHYLCGCEAHLQSTCAHTHILSQTHDGDSFSFLLQKSLTRRWLVWGYNRNYFPKVLSIFCNSLQNQMVGKQQNIVSRFGRDGNWKKPVVYVCMCVFVLVTSSLHFTTRVFLLMYPWLNGVAKRQNKYGLKKKRFLKSVDLFN